VATLNINNTEKNRQEANEWRTCLNFDAEALSISLDAACGAAQRCKLHAEHRCDAPFCSCDKSF
jgi:hypothetical protein